MQNLEEVRAKAGFAKIERTCQIARYRGLLYAWVDTCCIDKSSSAELTEAINSMFRFYKLSAICFVYLSDLSGRHGVSVGESNFNYFPLCKWFTRGWTLQESCSYFTLHFKNTSRFWSYNY